MKFFNPKEDVIDLKMTQYGKHLLSKGKFIPKYYAFFDDDIIYDIRWVTGSLSERQSDIEDRIQDETPRPRVQNCYHGVETEIKKVNELVRQKKAKLGDDMLQPMASKHHVMTLPLGNSSLHSNKLPAWQAYFLKGSLSASVDYTTGSSPNIKIPQLDCEILYKARVFAEGEHNIFGEPGRTEGGPLAEDYQPIEFGNTEIEFDDGSGLKVFEDSILLEVEESNTDYLEENFDIEVYEIKTIPASPAFNLEAMIAATGTVTLDYTDGLEGSGDNPAIGPDMITIKSTDGTEIQYRVSFEDPADYGGIYATGQYTDSTTPRTVYFNLHSSIVPVTEDAAQNENSIAQLRLAILHENGHNGKISVSAPINPGDGKFRITLTQAVGGEAGNNTIIYEVDEGTLGDEFNVSGFTGGTGTPEPLPGHARGEKEELIPLYFARQQSNLGTVYLTNAPEGSAQNVDEMFPDVDPNYVEYFFEVNVDREIDRATVCKVLPKDKTRSLRLAREFKCPADSPNRTLADMAGTLYESEQQDLDDFEECE